jgi:hypothetical protein
MRASITIHDGARESGRRIPESSIKGSRHERYPGAVHAANRGT